MRQIGKSTFYPVTASDTFTFYQPITLSCQIQTLKIINRFLNANKKPAILIVGGNCGNGKTHLICFSCEEFKKVNPHIGIYRHRNETYTAELFNGPPENTSFLICDGNLWSRDTSLNTFKINRILNRGISILIDVFDSDLLLEKIDFSKIDFVHTKVRSPSYLDKIKFFYYLFQKRLGRKPVLWDFFEIIKKPYQLKSLRGIEGGIARIRLKRDLGNGDESPSK